MKKGFIYITTNNITNLKYIGKKYYFYKNGKESNWKKYLGSSKLLLSDIEKYGSENFTREILFECDTEKELAEKETQTINEHNAVNSLYYYNLSNSHDKFYTTEVSVLKGLETREKWSVEKKQHISNKLKISHKNRSPEQEQIRREKISLAHKGKPEFKAMRSKVSKEVLSKRTEAEKHRIYEKISKSVKGYYDTWSEEERRRHINLRAKAYTAMTEQRQQKALDRKQTIITIINIKTKESFQMTIEKAKEFLNITDNSLYQLIKGTYSTYNIYKKTWTIQ